ncbi:SIS domain-containing protein [bacterium]|nr:SIS domain-containing protein [bacterium]
MMPYAESLHNFTQQFDYVLEQYKEHGISMNQIDNIVLGGLGGSGITAEIAKSWYFTSCPKPIETVHNYTLPAYINERSLVVLNSYSGNTEETLEMYEQAKAKNSIILLIASGGKLAEIAKQDQRYFIEMPTGYQPRMTYGMGLGFLLMILGELMGDDTRSELEKSRDRFASEKESQIESAGQIFNYFASSLNQKFVILADNNYLPLATRFAQQVNENAKLEAFVHPIPEANHNVLESYTNRLPTNFLMIFSEDHQRVAARFDFLISHLEMENNKVMPLVIPSFSFHSLFDLTYRLDWVSVMMAEELGANLDEVPIIMNLKGFLADLEIIEEAAEEEDE